MSESKKWSRPPDSLTLQNGEVHVWRVELDQRDEVVDEFWKTLEPSETDRANRFHFETHRRGFVVSRGFLRLVIGRYFGTSPGALRFSYGPSGKPALNGPHQDSRLRFNLSHSHGVALFAFTEDKQLGVDVEHVREDFASEEIARRFFSRSEFESLCSLPVEQQVAAFFRCWTRKEAFIKATGKGLSQPLDAFDVTLAPEVPAALLRVSDDEAERWSMFDVEVGEGYAGALAVEGRVTRIRHLGWST